jgi:GMP synthase (glutamine-hydrolysing)
MMLDGSSGSDGRPRDVLIVLHGEDSCPGRVGQLLRRRGYRLDIRKPRFGSPLPETLDRHAGAVIFGGPMSANDNEDFIKTEIGWIGVALKEEKPYLGICLGAQMLAKHLGAAVAPHAEHVNEIGYYELSPTEAGRTHGDWPEKVYHWHREGFELPCGAELIATGRDFPNQACIYGPAAAAIQFHPEITYALVNRWSADASWRAGRKGAQSREEQLTGHIRYGASVAAWLDRFLGRWLAGRIGNGAMQDGTRAQRT